MHCPFFFESRADKNLFSKKELHLGEGIPSPLSLLKHSEKFLTVLLDAMFSFLANDVEDHLAFPFGSGFVVLKLLIAPVASFSEHGNLLLNSN